MQYRVHMYPVAHIEVKVEAESMEDAIRKAEDRTDIHALFSRVGVNYAGHIVDYLVDVVGDEDYQHSQLYVPDPESPSGYRAVTPDDLVARDYFLILVGVARAARQLLDRLSAEFGLSRTTREAEERLRQAFRNLPESVLGRSIS